MKVGNTPLQLQARHYSSRQSFHFLMAAQDQYELNKSTTPTK